MIRKLACVLALVAGAAGGETVTLSPAQMRVVASESVVKGLPQQASDLAQALIKRDETDVDAWLILSRAARDLNDLNGALNAARKAWSLADDEYYKFAAAMARAQALSSLGKRTRAQVWLRTAVQNAPDKTARQNAIRDFKYVQSRNRWSTQLRFDISPSDNINNGSTSDTTELFGLPFLFALGGASRALSGTEIASGIGTRYRLSETPLTKLDVTFDLSHTTYVLSDKAKKLAPDLQGRDLAVTQAEVGLVHNGLIANTPLSYSGALELGRAWYSGDPYMQFARTTAGLGYKIGRSAQVTANLGQEWQEGLGGRLDADITRARLTYAQSLGRKAQMVWTLGWENSQSDATFLDYERRDVGVQLALAKPILGAHVTFGLSASEKHHSESRLTGGERNEITVGADMSLTFGKVEFLGFVPSIRVHSSRTDGNIDLLDKAETGIGFGIKSAF